LRTLPQLHVQTQHSDDMISNKNSPFRLFAPPSGQSGQKNPLKAILAGGISGGIEICITYPTEFVKTVLQLDKNSRGPARYTGVIDCVKKIVAEKGVSGLYRGLSPLFYMSIPKVGVRFMAFETAANFFKVDGKLTTGSNAICGLIAGFFEAVIVTTPMETVKVKFIDDWTSGKKPKYPGFISGIRLIIQEQTLSGIYKGLWPTVFKQSTNQMIRFVVYGEMVKLAIGQNKPDALNGFQRFYCGAVAGAASVLGNTPIDVVKTRMQGLEASRYKGSIDCAMQVWRNEGFFWIL